jgi:hypothetical protein
MCILAAAPCAAAFRADCSEGRYSGMDRGVVCDGGYTLFSRGDFPEGRNDSVPFVTLADQGLHGYISCHVSPPPMNYTAGVAFYSAVWPLIDHPIANFQIGLPSTWIQPDNSDNLSTPLCPPGSLARQWPERGPSWSSVFQTVEGGIGYWAGSHFHYGSPKFSMNGTPNCYDEEIASPGWSFFYHDDALPDGELGVAQVSNRLLVPPDGLPFAGNPNGALLGYGYMALPLTRPHLTDSTPTGNQSWTLFLNAENFKGPVAFYVPETWSKVSIRYPFDRGRGLDARPGIAGSMAIEINTVPHFLARGLHDTVYTKIPQLQFPVDDRGRTILVQDVAYYSKNALYDKLERWINGGPAITGEIDTSDCVKPALSTRDITYDQDGISITGINAILKPSIFPGNVFGIQWSSSPLTPEGKFPQYFKQVNHQIFPVKAGEVPSQTGLADRTFPDAPQGSPYTSPDSGAWKTPGPSKGPYRVVLADHSVVTYYWYKFIDQPVFHQFHWSQEEKDRLQKIVEKIQAGWAIDKNYLPPPSRGTLAALDSALLVTPPRGLEVGYVPIVTHQERARQP